MIEEVFEKYFMSCRWRAARAKGQLRGILHYTEIVRFLSLIEMINRQFFKALDKKATEPVKYQKAFDKAT
jgi:hypothetical protein